MTYNLAVIEPEASAVANLVDGIELAKEYSKHARSVNTNRAYRSDWADFDAWCRSKGVRSLPAEPKTVGVYIAEQASRLKPASISRRLTSIQEAHKLVNFPLDTSHSEIGEVLSGIRRVHSTAQKGKAPILTSDIRELVKHLPDTLTGKRDRALLLIGFAGAFRRSEIVSIDREDLSFDRKGLTIHIKRSKTDQEGEGRDVAIPYGSNLNTCPIRSLQDWIDVSGITQGAVFRGINRHGQIALDRLCDKAVALVVKRAVYSRAIANNLKVDEAEQEVVKFAGHSLRAGLATSAAMAGVSEHAIMRQTGHKRTDMVRKYIRIADPFHNNAAAQVGL